MRFTAYQAWTIGKETDFVGGDRRPRRASFAARDIPLRRDPRGDCRHRCVTVHASARKHGVLPEDATHAATWARWIGDLDDDSPARRLRLGFDTQGRLPEVVVLVFDSGNELVIHAMRARPEMLDLLP